MSGKERQLFGTDGIRGPANQHPVTPEIALRLGMAIAQVCAVAGGKTRIVIGRDTRISGSMLEAAVAAGIAATGAEALLLGVVPTPAVAFLTRQLEARAGVVISASHNPFEDNGIKFFGHDGNKLDDAAELEIEHLLNGEPPRALGENCGQIVRHERALEAYVAHAVGTLPQEFSLDGMKLVLDAANGAAFRSTPLALQQLGADVAVFHAAPDGININAGCGSTFPAEISRLVRERGAKVGISHDGDADRLVLCDENGSTLDGDEILAIAARDLLQKGRLAARTLVLTVMSNFGVDEMIETEGGQVVRTAVGDRYVLERMLADNLNLGGEQSGHIIFRDHSTTGDGLVAALQILRIMRETGEPLGQLRRMLVKYPQAQRNIRVTSKPAIPSLSGVEELIADAEADLAGKGRVLLRYSGTEPKIRLLIEGRDEALINSHADSIAAEIQKLIGA